jgi:hypothetical protein
MLMKKRTTVAMMIAIGACVLTSSSANAAVIGLEDFDGGAINLSSTSNVFDFGAGGGSSGDVFGRVSPGFAGGTGAPFDVADDSVGVGGTGYSGAPAFPDDTLGIAGNNTSAFFAMNDMDGSTAPDPVLSDATWTFDITSAQSIDNIQIDLAAMGDFEASSSDGFSIWARVDANPYQQIFLASTDEDTFKSYRPLDGGFVFMDDDPLELFIDGAAVSVGFLDKSVAATGQFDTYTSTLLTGSVGSTLDVQVQWTGTPSGSEPMGIDNITINGTPIPEPATIMLLAAAGLGVVGLRFRWK